MFRKSFALMLLLALAAFSAVAQDAPKSKNKSKESKNKAKSVYSIAFGGGSYLGVRMTEVTQENFSKYGLSGVRGVAVTKVMDDSPAAKAGIKDGDVLVSFNGEAVTSTRKLRRLISEVAPDHTAKVTVVRGGSEQSFDVKMGKHKGNAFFRSRAGNTVFTMPDIAIPTQPNVVIPRMPRVPRISVAPGRGGNFFFRSSRSIGVSVSSLTKQLGDYFGVADGKGLLVTRVVKDSPADKAGIKAGDVIVEVEGEKVSRNFDLIRKMSKKKEGDISITLVRDKQSRTVKVTPKKGKDGNTFFFSDSDISVIADVDEDN